MNHRLRIWLITSTLLLLLVACGGAEPGAGTPAPGPDAAKVTAPLDDALAQDAQWYAAEHGIDLDEAMRRLALQDTIGALNAELAEKERATFAGLWIEHEPEFRVFVRFTERGAATLQPYIEGGPLEGIVEVRDAAASLEGLTAAHRTAMSAIDELGIDVSSAVNVPENQVEVLVADPIWFQEQLDEAGIRLPDHVELVAAGGRSAGEIDICATPAVPGVAFPRQGPIEGPRVVMEAELIGQLVLVDGCLRIDSIHGAESLLPIWPPEFGLAAEGDEIQVLDGEGQVVALVGEEVYMGGGGGSAAGLAECVQQQLPATCTGPYWIVGDGVRPNLRRDSDLFSLEVVETPARSFFLLHKEPVLDGWIESESRASGKLVLWDYDRCPRIVNENGLGNYLPLWPMDYSATVEDGAIAIVDGSGQTVARVGEEVVLSGGPIPHSWDSEEYRQLFHELPGDCSPPYWIVGE
jgi:antitoxin component of RelBE/YafQ-DinJ toxin-antitoxin module